jgi:hypothetical protein
MNIKKILDGMLNKVFGAGRSRVTSKEFKLSTPPQA